MWLSSQTKPSINDLQCWWGELQVLKGLLKGFVQPRWNISKSVGLWHSNDLGDVSANSVFGKGLFV